MPTENRKKKEQNFREIWNTIKNRYTHTGSRSRGRENIIKINSSWKYLKFDEEH